MIVSGRLVGDERLDETGLAARIGASRTPVREALIALEEEGLVRSRPNHGFVVASLNYQLVREIYPILGALEGAALELGGKALRRAAPHLTELCERLSREKRSARCYELDREFHRAIAAASGNARLIRLIDQHWNHARRIDGGEARGMANHKGSTKEHLTIVRQIERGDFTRAADLLRAHWHSGIDIVQQWMVERT